MSTNIQCIEYKCIKTMIQDIKDYLQCHNGNIVPGFSSKRNSEQYPSLSFVFMDDDEDDYVEWFIHTNYCNELQMVKKGIYLSYLYKEITGDSLEITTELFKLHNSELKSKPYKDFRSN